MKLSRETICRDTQYMLERYYDHDLEPILSALTDDCVWLSVGNLLASGKQSILSCFKNGFVMPRFTIESPDFRLIETGSNDQLLVLGQFFLYPEEEAETICAVKQRISCSFRKEKAGFRMYHIHTSNEWNELVDDEVYAVSMGAQTYQYVQKILAENGCPCTQKLVIKNDSSSEFIDVGLLVYVEAMDKHTILHMVGEKREVKIPFKEMLELLPKQFCRLHRSYAINCTYVKKIERYMLTLITMEQIPIPKMRYKEITEEIEKRNTK